MRRRECLRDQATERNTGDMGARDTIALEQSGQLRREVFDAVWAVRHRRFAVAGQIITDERQLARQRERGPRVPIDAEQCSSTRNGRSRGDAV